MILDLDAVADSERLIEHDEETTDKVGEGVLRRQGESEGDQAERGCHSGDLHAKVLQHQADADHDDGDLAHTPNHRQYGFGFGLIRSVAVLGRDFLAIPVDGHAEQFPEGVTNDHGEHYERDVVQKGPQAVAQKVQALDGEINDDDQQELLELRQDRRDETVIQFGRCGLDHPPQNSFEHGAGKSQGEQHHQHRDRQVDPVVGA